METVGEKLHRLGIIPSHLMVGGLEMVAKDLLNEMSNAGLDGVQQTAICGLMMKIVSAR